MLNKILSLSPPSFESGSLVSLSDIWELGKYYEACGLSIYLDCLLGRGTFGEVYYANILDPNTGHEAPFAFKVGLAFSEPVDKAPPPPSEYAESIKTEWNLLSSLDHRNIVNCVDSIHFWVTVNDDAVCPFDALILELATLGNFNRIIHDIGQNKDYINCRLLVFLFDQIAQAIRHLCLEGVIHRDIKPDNILLDNVDGRLTPKICDFGLGGRRSDPPHPHFAYSADFRPPEIQLGGNESETGDVYAFSMLMLVVLKGGLILPSTETDLELNDVLLQFLGTDFASIRQFNRDYRLALADQTLDDTSQQYYEDILGDDYPDFSELETPLLSFARLKGILSLSDYYTERIQNLFAYPEDLDDLLRIVLDGLKYPNQRISHDELNDRFLSLGRRMGIYASAA